MTLLKLRFVLIGLLASLLTLSGAPAEAKPKAPPPTRAAKHECDPCEQARRAAAKLRACGLAIKQATKTNKVRTKKPKLAKVKAAAKKVQAAKGKVRTALKKAKEVSAKKVAAKTRAKKGEKLPKSFWDMLNVAEKEAAKGIAAANKDVTHAINELTDCTVDAYKEADIPLAIVEPTASEYATRAAHAAMSEEQEEAFIATSEAKLASHDDDYANFEALSDEASDESVGAIVEDLGDDLYEETEVVETVYYEAEEDDAEEAATGDYFGDEADDNDHDVASPDQDDTDHDDADSGDDHSGSDDHSGDDDQSGDDDSGAHDTDDE